MTDSWNWSDESQIDQLPKEQSWEGLCMYQWKGFWFERKLLEASMAFHSQFEARDDDVILTSSIKTGTTWLKSLCLSIVHRNNINTNNIDDDVLMKASPHIQVPTIESMVYSADPYPIISGMTSPRLLHTHLPLSVFPDSVLNKSGCKIVYITRNPKDTFVSLWHFLNIIFRQYNQQPIPLERAFESFLRGAYVHGPFFDHVLEFWKQSLKMPEKILFLKYEEVKRDPIGQVKVLASFLGRPFGNGEEVDGLLKRCSLERLKNLDVNKNGFNSFNGLPNSSYFRLGIVGDSKNYLTPEMEQRLNDLSREKLEPFGLQLDI